MVFHLRVAGRTVALRAGDSLFALLSSYYAALEAPVAREAEAIVQAREDAAILSVPPGEPVAFRLGGAAMAPIAAAALVLRGLATLRPDLVFLHGNALLDGATGRAILAVGESGAGKTTLAAELVRADPRIQAVSEDVLILDPVAGVLHPFPRTPTVEPRDAPEDALAWGAKRLVPWSGRRGLEAVPLDGACVVVLERSGGGGERRGGALRVVASWVDDAVARAVASASPGYRSWSRTGETFSIEFDPAPSGGDLRRVAAALDACGSLLLATEIASRGAPRSPRAEEGSGRARAMDGGEAIGVLAAHRISPWPARRSTPGEFMAAMARCLCTARFARIARAGTPGETAALAIGAIRPRAGERP